MTCTIAPMLIDMILLPDGLSDMFFWLLGQVLHTEIGRGCPGTLFDVLTDIL
jgi:hypothetical protein